MSVFHVSTAFPFFRAEPGDRVVRVDPAVGGATFSIDTRDALSDPAVEALLPSGLSLWPRGAAWGTPDGIAASTGSVLAGLTRALLSPLASLYARAFALTAESRASTIVDSLADWERDYGLPDDCRFDEETESQRRAGLARRVLAEPVVSPEDFVRLAALHRAIVAIEEPEAFACGDSTCGSGDEVSDVMLDLHFVVRVFDVDVTVFEAGIGEAGVTRLLDFDIDGLVCLFERHAPGWTEMYFDVSDVLQGFAKIVDGEAAFVRQGLSYVVLPVPGEAIQTIYIDDAFRAVIDGDSYFSGDA